MKWLSLCQHPIGPINILHIKLHFGLLSLNYSVLPFSCLTYTCYLNSFMSWSLSRHFFLIYWYAFIIYVLIDYIAYHVKALLCNLDVDVSYLQPSALGVVCSVSRWLRQIILLEKEKWLFEKVVQDSGAHIKCRWCLRHSHIFRLLQMKILTTYKFNLNACVNCLNV